MVFIEKYLHINGPAEFKPMLFQGQRYYKPSASRRRFKGESPGWLGLLPKSTRLPNQEFSAENVGVHLWLTEVVMYF